MQCTGGSRLGAFRILHESFIIVIVDLKVNKASMYELRRQDVLIGHLGLVSKFSHYIERHVLWHDLY